MSSSAFTPGFLSVLGSAGHISTVMCLLNYYGGIDTEMKDCRGFMALIKAAMIGRTDVGTFMLHLVLSLVCVCVCI